jgi:MFS family permease
MEDVPLRRPPVHAMVVSLAMFAIGAVTGAILASFQDVFYAAARREIIRRPEIHGFAGAEAIDQGRIAEVADQANAALRLLHTHTLGLGALILLTTLIIANLPISHRLRSVLCALLSLGGIYPLGWALLAWLIPITGVEPLRNIMEWFFFVPFAGPMIIGLLSAVIFLFVGWLRPPKTSKTSAS